ncbi:MAG TPA: site-specific integrase [Bacteroidia bacterium]|nr:site-specific integrase [Bacteroidia bacterium]HNS13214.1 site-specific integrase [Bacteroidia bacterium]
MSAKDFLPVKISGRQSVLRNRKAEIVPFNEMQIAAINAYVALLKLKNYSENTIKTYRNWFMFFLKCFHDRKPSQIRKEEILDLMISLHDNENWSATGQNQMINAIKFFYEQLLKRPREMYDLPRAQKPKQLPTVFSEKEVLSIIKATGNLKHKTILCLAYASGLRISEISKMKIRDIDSDRMVINIRQSKGKQDRIVMLSERLLLLLRTYFLEYKPKVWLFEGQTGGQYSIRSISKVMEQCKRKARVYKKGGIHALRHSFATHLLESGTDIMFIKELLGHQSLQTTMTYVHVSKKNISKIQSPFDKL